MRWPPPLVPGDVVHVVAPSSPFEEGPVRAALAWLAERYVVRFDAGLFARAGYLAGDDARRRDELARALGAPDVKAILAARGGYGASRFAHEIDFAILSRSPRWIVGFSDITVLHAEAWRAGVASIHGPHLSALGRADPEVREAFVRILESPATPRTFSGLSTVVSGSHTGTLVGGNLAVLHATAAAGRLALPAGAVLLLEDVTERPYRIDRMLTTLELGGHLAAVGAVVLGDFTQCDPGADGITAGEVLFERLGRLGVPVVAGLPCGHGEVNEPLVLGGEARVEGEARVDASVDRGAAKLTVRQRAG